MEVIDSPELARKYVTSLRSQGRTVGFVPTMGALHDGHLSLVQAARSCDFTVASIFVNPTQFGPNEDLETYPRTLQSDLESLEQCGVSAVFAPTAETMYPKGYSTYVSAPKIGDTLEGVCRPGHFRGVVTVVLKLFQTLPVPPAYFGKKDYQQWRVIEAMTRDLSLGTEIIGCETVRESDGLAMSSRNRYLSQEERQRALLLSESLAQVEKAYHAGERCVESLQHQMHSILTGQPGSADSHTETLLPSMGLDSVDYATIVAAQDLTPMESIDRPAVALIAGNVGMTRLIDNRELPPL